MSDREEIRDLTDKIILLDRHISELEESQNNIKSAVAQTDTRMEALKRTVWDAKMAVNRVCVAKPVYHYTSEDAVESSHESAAANEVHAEPAEAVAASAADSADSKANEVLEPLPPEESMEYAQEPLQEACQIPYPDHTEHRTAKGIDWEKLIGRNAMGIMASVLIFISLGIFGALVFPLLGNTIKFILMTVFSATVAAAGYMRTEKTRNAFSISLLSCGIGAMYITFLCGRLMFGMYGDLVLFVLFFLWAAGNHVLYRRYESVVFSAIGHLGILTSVILACKNIMDLYAPGYDEIITDSMYTDAMRGLMATAVFLILAETVYAAKMKGLPELCFKTASMGLSSILLLYACDRLNIDQYLMGLEEPRYMGLTAPVHRPELVIPYYALTGLILITLSCNAITDFLWTRKRSLLMTQICGLVDSGILYIAYLGSCREGTGAYLIIAEALLLTLFIRLYPKTGEKNTETDILNKIYLVAIMMFPALYIPLEVFPLFKYAGMFWFAVPFIITALRNDRIRTADVMVADIVVILTNLIPVNYIRYTSDTESMEMIFIAGITGALCITHAVLNVRYAKRTVSDTWQKTMMCISSIECFTAVIAAIPAIESMAGSYPILLTLNKYVYGTMYVTGIAIVAAGLTRSFKDMECPCSKFAGIADIICSFIGFITVADFDLNVEWLVKEKSYLEQTPLWTVPGWLNSRTSVYALFTILVIAVTAVYMITTMYTYRTMSRRVFGIVTGVAYTLLWMAVSDKADIPYLMSAGLIVWSVICIAIGFRLKTRSMRLYGLTLSIFSVAKLILMDIYYDNSIARAVSMAVCGILLFIISFVYNRVEKAGQASDSEQSQGNK